MRAADVELVQQEVPARSVGDRDSVIGYVTDGALTGKKYQPDRLEIGTRAHNMSKHAKSARALKRRQEKAKRKAAQRARYATYRDQGVNQKSKRFMRQKRKLVRTRRHLMAFCGNVGCARCSQVASTRGCA
jgi:hypothetical protein